jgi:hypothetical protein
MQHEKGNCPEVYAQRPNSFEKSVYKRRAARPMAAAMPGMAVCMAPAAFEELVDEPVAEEAPDAPAELALDAMLLAFDNAELAALEPLERAELALDPAWALAEEALPLAPPPKMVVEPTVVVKVEEPEVSTETIAEVVMAEEDPPAEDEPDPPATPPIP